MLHVKSIVSVSNIPGPGYLKRKKLTNSCRPQATLHHGYWLMNSSETGQGRVFFRQIVQPSYKFVTFTVMGTICAAIV